MNPRVKFVFGASICALCIPSMAFASTATYTVHRGDTLTSVAKKYHTTASVIEEANHLTSSHLTPGQVLAVPVINQDALRTTMSLHSTATASVTHKKSTLRHWNPLPRGPVQYVTVYAGDTLWGLANQYGVSVYSLAQWNHLDIGSTLALGRKLRLYNGHTSAPRRNSDSSSALSGRSEQATGTLATAIVGQRIVNYAERFLGVPYVWGGESAYGFDCSGLVAFTYAHFDIWLPRDSFDQYDSGTWIPEQDLLPGDLVFFDTDGSGASHVGIYVGGGEFISASGSEVQFSSLNSAYWGGHYIGAKRVH